jgi:glutathione S-transferase
MMKLYWSPRSRSFSSLWLMEETGQPYERVLTDISAGAQKTPEFLAINPMGKVPALSDGDATLAEAAAICAYVTERYPEAKLAPPPGDPLRAKYLYWLFFAPGCIEPAMVQVATKIEMNPVAAGWGNAQLVFDVLDAALTKGPWILGESFSAADIAIGSGLISRCGCSRWCQRARHSTATSIAARRGRHSSAPASSRRAKATRRCSSNPPAAASR